MKFHKQRDLIILISKHFEFFKLDQYSEIYSWLKFAVFPFDFCVYFLWIWCSDIKTLVSFYLRLFLAGNLWECVRRCVY